MRWGPLDWDEWTARRADEPPMPSPEEHALLEFLDALPGRGLGQALQLAADTQYRRVPRPDVEVRRLVGHTGPKEAAQLVGARRGPGVVGGAPTPLRLFGGDGHEGLSAGPRAR